MDDNPLDLPPNQAVALHEEFIYVAVKVNGETLILAKELLDYCMDAFGYKNYNILDEFPGSVLEGLKAKHPLVDRESLLPWPPLSPSMGNGTGAIAPGHGQEDYEIGMKYGLDNYAPVDDEGRYTSDVKDFAGQFVFDANESVIKKLAEVGVLLGRVDIGHTYPHCWRCKNPIIFIFTEQWFISMDKNNLRQKTLEAIETVAWLPAWGRDRISGMIRNRPDWCISRQRLWGGPITMFSCSHCKSDLMTKDIIAHVVKLVNEYGADVWFERDTKDLLPAGTVCPVCQSDQFSRETDNTPCLV